MPGLRKPVFRNRVLSSRRSHGRNRGRSLSKNPGSRSRGRRRPVWSPGRLPRVRHRSSRSRVARKPGPHLRPRRRRLFRHPLLRYPLLPHPHRQPLLWPPRPRRRPAATRSRSKTSRPSSHAFWGARSRRSNPSDATGVSPGRPRALAARHPQVRGSPGQRRCLRPGRPAINRPASATARGSCAT